jgi:uncharacterized membrane protein YqiK
LKSKIFNKNSNFTAFTLPHMKIGPRSDFLKSKTQKSLTNIMTKFPPIRFTGTLTVEEVYKDRDQFAALVREVAAPDVGRMGIEILSFTIKDVYDDVQYLQSLGKAQTASVKRDADSGVAEANRFVDFAAIRVSLFKPKFCEPTEMLESAKQNARKRPWT